MTEPTQQQQIDRLAEWMGWREHGYYGGWYAKQTGEHAATKLWNPFTSHDHAHLLLKECERRGMNPVGEVLWEQGVPEEVPSDRNLAYKAGLRAGWQATPEQKTNAVWAVAFPEEKL